MVVTAKRKATAMRLIELATAGAICTILWTMPCPVLGAAAPAMSASQWQQDLDYMAQCIERYHVNPFHDVSRADFEERVKVLRARMPQLDRAQDILGLASIISLVRDAHTGFGIGTTPPISF